MWLVVRSPEIATTETATTVTPTPARRRRDTNDNQLSDSTFARLWSKVQGFLGADSAEPVASKEKRDAVDQDAPEVFTT